MNRRLALGAAVAGTAALLPAFRHAAAQGASDQLRELALSGGTFSLRSSELALQRAASPQVRQFAELEAEEQQAVLRAMQISGVPIPPTVMMDGTKVRMLESLGGLSGADFDRMYVTGQVAGHQELLQTYGSIAQGGATPPERSIATLAVPSIRTHLALLSGIQSQLRG